MNVAYKAILPKHIFQQIGIDGWQTWQPDPPVEPMVTSGTFYVTDWIRGEFMELTHNPSFFYRMDRESPSTSATTATNTTNTTGTSLNGTGFQLSVVAGAISAAAVITIGGSYIIRKYAAPVE
ncbi:MAG: hypothetical protein EAX95_16210 [Candidatus Thorarchaeota archaeon]|nr:hypothetical protein [Candidatus Thorarchaeota archaeon]